MTKASSSSSSSSSSSGSGSSSSSSSGSEDTSTSDSPSPVPQRKTARSTQLKQGPSGDSRHGDRRQGLTGRTADRNPERRKARQSSGSSTGSGSSLGTSRSPTPARRHSSHGGARDSQRSNHDRRDRARQRSRSPVARYDRRDHQRGSRTGKGLSPHRSRYRERSRERHRQNSDYRHSERDIRDSRDRGRRQDTLRRDDRSERRPKRAREERPEGRDQGYTKPLPGPPPQAEQNRGRDRTERRRPASGFDGPLSGGVKDSNDGTRGGPAEEVWGVDGNRAEPRAEEKKVEPNFELSGALAEETNTVNNVALVYSEPPEAAQPTQRWRLYTFKGGDLVGEPLYIHRQRSYLFGRERRVADIPADHPSCSKQHAILQYRRTNKIGDEGLAVEAVRPYLMDLGSTNGTFINSEQLEAQRYYELMEKAANYAPSDRRVAGNIHSRLRSLIASIAQDVVKLGNSSREYVLLHEGSLQTA